MPVGEGVLERLALVGLVVSDVVEITSVELPLAITDNGQEEVDDSRGSWVRQAISQDAIVQAKCSGYDTDIYE